MSLFMKEAHIICSSFLNVMKGLHARHNPLPDAHRLDIEVNRGSAKLNSHITSVITRDRLSLEVGIWKIVKEPQGRMSPCP